MSAFHKLSIKNYIQETANAVSIVFDVPENLKTNFSYKAGQYITLKATVNGNEIRRAYTICSAPESDELKVAIKAVENGVFSTYATSQLKVGDLIEVHEPEGKLMLEPTKSNNYLGILSPPPLLLLFASIFPVFSLYFLPFFMVYLVFFRISWFF